MQNAHAKEVWLIRHGETDWNAQGRVQGNSDIPLNALGESQAARLARRLNDAMFDSVHASDLQRAMRTAQVALPSAPVMADPRLRELAYGLFEGMVVANPAPDVADAWRAWSPNRQHTPAPGGGESYNQLQTRMLAFVEALPAGRHAAFTHGGAIRSLLYRVMGTPHGQGVRVDIDNTSITRLRVDARGFTIVTLNDHAHLHG
jgi:probable phosphoglycerate mutase